MTGPAGLRVLRFDGVFGPEGCGSGFHRSLEKKGARLMARVVAACGGRLCRKVVFVGVS